MAGLITSTTPPLMAKYIHAALGMYGEDMGDIAISLNF